MASSAWSLNHRNGVIFFICRTSLFRARERREVRGEVIEDLGVAGALLLLVQRHLERERQTCPAEDVLEGGRQHPPVAEDLHEPLGPDDLAVRAVENEALLTVIGGAHAHAERAALTHVGLGERRLP